MSCQPARSARPRGRCALRRELQQLPPRSPHALARSTRVHDVSRTADHATRRTPWLPRLSRGPRGAISGGYEVRSLSRDAEGSRPRRCQGDHHGSSTVHELSCAARVRQARGDRVRELPREEVRPRAREAHQLHRLSHAPRSGNGALVQRVSCVSASRASGDQARSLVVRRVSSAPCACRRREGDRLRELSRQTTSRDDAMPGLSRATREASHPRGRAVREVPRRAGERHAVHRARGLYQVSCLRGARAEEADPLVCHLPCKAHRTRPRGLHVVSSRRSTSTAGSEARMRDVPHGAGEHRARRASGLRELPRLPHRRTQAGRDVRELPRRSREHGSRYSRRVRVLPSSARTRPRRAASDLRVVPSRREAPGPARERRTRAMRELSPGAREDAA